jgi:hypothetical protein
VKNPRVGDGDQDRAAEAGIGGYGAHEIWLDFAGHNRPKAKRQSAVGFHGQLLVGLLLRDFGIPLCEGGDKPWEGAEALEVVLWSLA